jgi:hypothetical protein
MIALITLQQQRDIRANALLKPFELFLLDSFQVVLRDDATFLRPTFVRPTFVRPTFVRPDICPTATFVQPAICPTCTQNASFVRPIQNASFVRPDVCPTRRLSDLTLIQKVNKISVHPSVHPSACLSVRPSVRLSFCHFYLGLPNLT